ncbi:MULTISPECIES: metallophosphoesterase family protein [unclassified Sphingomonas]|uniref:metallophosphoesterase family protein n=1 Tax=unclassified Sphingomonas TaxID=196159 RepID=UPI0006F2ADFB|nr:MULTISPECIES: metallophosphoesterase family protein [unclassified Sphingomonas]KQX18093.1 metallophosphoesterase [Sphingomonas sp. Root1294]KQY72648.1 metallophosphoesterase [Sphingomonas sp. Root50]KRB87728.1 metallophosphoesterase [Sphingomonas sp. Root720]
MTMTPRRPAPPRDSVEAKVDGQLLYAIGDIHGCYQLLRELLSGIAADAEARWRGRRPIIVLLGDLIDRGPHSAHVVEAVTWLQRFHPFEVRLLMGNHERAMLEFVEHPADHGDWLMFGGDATLRCYGVEPPPPGAPARALIAARDALLPRMPASHLLCLQQALPMLVLGDYAFVHAGIRPGRPLARQEEEDLLWIGAEFTASTERFEKIIVHGHTIAAEPQLAGNRIGIDTGAYQSGTLTALRIEDGDVGLIQTGKKAADGVAR